MMVARHNNGGVKIEVGGGGKGFFPGIEGGHRVKTKLIHKPQSRGEYAEENRGRKSSPGNRESGIVKSHGGIIVVAL